MSRKTINIFTATAGSIVLLIYGCRQQRTQARPVNTFSVKGSVREMVINPETPEFPEHEGKAEFVSYCAICHSLKYISMQPNFSAKTWDAEVHKMVEKFGAPIDSTVSKKIVAYLVAIKGK